MHSMVFTEMPASIAPKGKRSCPYTEWGSGSLLGGEVRQQQEVPPVIIF